MTTDLHNSVFWVHKSSTLVSIFFSFLKNQMCQSLYCKTELRLICKNIFIITGEVLLENEFYIVEMSTFYFKLFSGVPVIQRS